MNLDDSLTLERYTFCVDRQKYFTHLARRPLPRESPARWCVVGIRKDSPRFYFVWQPRVPE